MKRWKNFLAVAALLCGLGGAVVASPTVLAVNVFDQCKQNGSASVCKAQGDSASGMIKTIINILLYVVGIIAVIMIIVGGVRYTVSNGNASQVKEAKDTILYSIVGLIVAAMSFAIVNFVISWF